MPTMQAADLWRQSGRWNLFGDEILHARDRHGRELVYGPTNEEMVADLMRRIVRSHRELPQTVYHVQWKFRDELRPRFGVMRAREFLMKDAYSFDLDRAGATVSYRRMMLAYMRTFRRLGVAAIPVAADSGAIGGDLSHEFVVLAEAGESAVFDDAALDGAGTMAEGVDPFDERGLERLHSSVTSIYAATEEKHDAARWTSVPSERRREGIGISRLLGAVIEANHDGAGIVWPSGVAPFAAAILNLRQGDPATDGLCRRLHEAIGSRALYDDRQERAGEKFSDTDLMGHPLQLVVGPRGAASGRVEVKRRASNERFDLSAEDALALVAREFP